MPHHGWVGIDVYAGRTEFRGLVIIIDNVFYFRLLYILRRSSSIAADEENLPPLASCTVECSKVMNWFQYLSWVFAFWGVEIPWDSEKFCRRPTNERKRKTKRKRPYLPIFKTAIHLFPIHMYCAPKRQRLETEPNFRLTNERATWEELRYCPSAWAHKQPATTIEPLQSWSSPDLIWAHLRWMILVHSKHRDQCTLL